MSGRKPLSGRTVDRALRARGWTCNGPAGVSARSGSWVINPEHVGQRLFAQYDGLQFTVSNGRLHDAERGLFAPNVHIVSYWVFTSTAELSAALDSIERIYAKLCGTQFPPKGGVKMVAIKDKVTFVADKMCGLLDEGTCLRCEAKHERNAPRLAEIKRELDMLKAKYPEAWTIVEKRWGVR